MLNINYWILIFACSSDSDTFYSSDRSLCICASNVVRTSRCSRLHSRVSELVRLMNRDFFFLSGEETSKISKYHF